MLFVLAQGLDLSFCEITTRKPIYSLNLTYFKVSYFNSLSNKSIKNIVHTFTNIIHLDFEKSMDHTGKALKLIAESYPNLKFSLGVR